MKYKSIDSLTLSLLPMHTLICQDVIWQDSDDFCSLAFVLWTECQFCVLESQIALAYLKSTILETIHFIWQLQTYGKSLFNAYSWRYSSHKEAEQCDNSISSHSTWILKLWCIDSNPYRGLLFSNGILKKNCKEIRIVSMDFSALLLPNDSWFSAPNTIMGLSVKKAPRRHHKNSQGEPADCQRHNLLRQIPFMVFGDWDAHYTCHLSRDEWRMCSKFCLGGSECPLSFAFQGFVAIYAAGIRENGVWSSISCFSHQSLSSALGIIAGHDFGAWAGLPIRRNVARDGYQGFTSNPLYVSRCLMHNPQLLDKPRTPVDST